MNATAPWQRWQDGPVAAAVLAPSPHNSQPWTFRVSDDAVDLYADLSRSTGALDPFGRELYVGLGCALENLLLAAAAHGYSATATLLPEPGLAAHVALAPGPVVRDPLYEAIPRRHTDRSAYARRPVPPAALEAMAGLAHDGTRLVWAADRVHVGRMLVEAARAVTEDEEQSRDGYALLGEHGLTLDTQAMPALVTAIAKRLPPASRRRADAFWLRSMRTQTRTASAFGFVAVPDSSDDRQRIEGGRLLQRVHLWTAANGLALQHMNQLTERADRERQLGLAPLFGAAIRQLVPDGWELLAAFRVGYAKNRRGQRLSPRRPAAGR